ncbi:MAG: hypothetical protein H7A53_07770 [Akkermansiaceae bacterium]|nr:hypothetical protein [Akkermansiaceae bacterium]
MNFLFNNDNAKEMTSRKYAEVSRRGRLAENDTASWTCTQRHACCPENHARPIAGIRAKKSPTWGAVMSATPFNSHSDPPANPLHPEHP